MSGHCWQYAYQVHYVWFNINGDNDKFIELVYFSITSDDHFIYRKTFTESFGKMNGSGSLLYGVDKECSCNKNSAYSSEFVSKCNLTDSFLHHTVL